MEKILVVDDEKEILNVLERYLTHMGYEPVLSLNWESAIEKFSKEQYDLVILDVNMPGRDGFQVAKEMKAKKPDQKIVIITGLSAGMVYKHFTESEVDVNDVLYKPFTYQKVKTIIETVLNP